MTTEKLKDGPRAKRGGTARAALPAAPGAAVEIAAPDAAPAVPAEPAAPAVRDLDLRQPPADGKRPTRTYSMPDEAYPEGTAKIADDFNDTNPFVEGDWRVMLNAWAGFALRIILVVSSAFGINQYLIIREESRVSRALELVELWEKPEYQKAQSELKLRLDSLNETQQTMLGAKPTPTELALYYVSIGKTAMRREGGQTPLPQFNEHFERVVYFLNRLAFCVDEGLCSERIADAFFGDFAESFWRYFSGYVYDQRKAGSVNYATQIEKYVQERQAAAAEAAN